MAIVVIFCSGTGFQARHRLVIPAVLLIIFILLIIHCEEDVGVTGFGI
ncbi:MAG TPA: hypothetical protein VJT08_06475 [Terriglobales bacterium]|nr:hypothetical protein [Terriglobales bacterium]